MPSRSSSAHTIGALLTASGLVIALTGLFQVNRLYETAGLALTIIGAIPLLALSYRTSRSDAAIRDIDEHRAEIEGKAFGLALELVRTGQLGATTLDSPGNPPGRR